MPVSARPFHLPPPRVVVVLAGACSEVGTPSTALERARMPELAALGAAGRVGRLRTVASHLPVSETTAAAALLGAVPPAPLDPGAVAAESLGRALAPGEYCTVVAVVDLAGDPAPALDVQRAVDTLRHQLGSHQLGSHRILGVHRGHRILLAGAERPPLPEIEGLDLHPAEPGFLPPRVLDDRTVVVATEGSVLLGVASLLGARTQPVDASRADRRDPVPARLRSRAAAALIGGAETVVVESRAPLDARRSPRAIALREQRLQRTLEALDRELIGPLRTATAWADACFTVTSDLARLPGGAPVRGEVPIAMTGPRSIGLPERTPPLAPPGTTLPPLHCERAVAGTPIVSSPHILVPAQTVAGPRRFTRDPRTGRTTADDVLVG